jgi:hypothetical protein
MKRKTALGIGTGYNVHARPKQLLIIAWPNGRARSRRPSSRLNVQNCTPPWGWYFILSDMNPLTRFAPGCCGGAGEAGSGNSSPATEEAIRSVPSTEAAVAGCLPNRVNSRITRHSSRTLEALFSKTFYPEAKMDRSIFARILAGEIPGSFIYRGERVSAFLDVQGVNEGHCLVVPNEQVSSLSELDPEIGKDLFHLAHRIATAYRKGVLSLYPGYRKREQGIDQKSYPHINAGIGSL